MAATASTDTRVLTAGDLLRLHVAGQRGELIRGELCETMPTEHEHGRIVVNLVVEMQNFLKPRRLGALTASDAEVVPDLVLEVASPGDSPRETNDKARMWLSFGVRLAWVVHPGTRRVDVHRPAHPVRTLGEHDALDGLDVLPGFTCAVEDVFGAG